MVEAAWRYVQEDCGFARILYEVEHIPVIKDDMAVVLQRSNLYKKDGRIFAKAK